MREYKILASYYSSHLCGFGDAVLRRPLLQVQASLDIDSHSQSDLVGLDEIALWD